MCRVNFQVASAASVFPERTSQRTCLKPKCEITVAPTATVGEHMLNVRLQMNFNGQNLVMERPMKLTVAEVKK